MTAVASEELQRQFSAATKQRTLFEIVEAFRAVFDRIDELEGEVTDDVGAELDALTESLEQKTEAYAAVCRQLEEEADACDRFVNHYKTRAKRKRSKIEALKARLQLAMELTGRAKIETPTATAALQKSPARLELLVPEHEAEKHIPEQYLAREVRIKTDEIKAALKGGEALPFARLVHGQHLRFR